MRDEEVEKLDIFNLSKRIQSREERIWGVCVFLRVGAPAKIEFINLAS